MNPNLFFFVILLTLNILFNDGLAKDVNKKIRVKITEYGRVCDRNSEYYKKTKKDCGIKRARFETQDYSLQSPNDPYPYYGTLAYSGFEANSWDDLLQYGFVQYIRGCTYEIKKNSDGTVTKRIGETIKHFGKRRIFTFPHWSFDANTSDPLYYGPRQEDAHLPGGRLSLYRWTPRLEVVDKDLAKDLYQVLQLPHEDRSQLTPAVYVVDTPSMAIMKGELKNKDNHVFQNVSLEFKICLYPLSEIPLEVQNDKVLKAIPLLCHKWESQYEFNFEKNDFELMPAKGQDAFCSTQSPKPPGV